MSLLMLSVSNERTLRPSKVMSPDARGTIFSRAKHRLVLPAPAAPTTAKRLPGCTAKLTLDRAATAGTRGGGGGEQLGGGTWTAATLTSANAMNEIEDDE